MNIEAKCSRCDEELTIVVEKNQKDHQDFSIEVQPCEYCLDEFRQSGVDSVKDRYGK